MRLKMMEAVGGFLILFSCAVSLHAQETVTQSETGSYGDVDYELWNQDDQGTATMTINEDGTFSCEWSGIENVLFRTGEKLGSDQTYQEMGDINVEFGADYNPDGNSYLCIYGWTEDPLVEYYIVESWGSWRPPGEGQQGSITVDGASYDLFVTERVNKPSIQGNATFDQYWSVRTSKRTSGTIPVSEHFEAWEENGLNMGNMYEVALTVEGYQSEGSADVHTYSINIGGDTTDPEEEEEEEDYGVRSATSTIEAEEYNSTTGADLEVVDASDGEGIGYINSGDAVTYNDIDFGDGVASVSVNVASEQST
ncbi:MAG: glycoside hydrolase family 11 protein, partial [Chitinivibrionales bacterium]